MLKSCHIMGACWSHFPSSAHAKGNAMAIREADLTCSLCHVEDWDIVLNNVRGFVVLCNECGYAQGATLDHLLAS